MGYIDILEYISIRNEEMLQILEHIKMEESSEPGKMLSEAREEIAWTLGRFANFVPLFKKGSSKNLESTSCRALHQWQEKSLMDRTKIHLKK